MKYKLNSFLIAVILPLALASRAQAGREGANGGDPCERRFLAVRDDIVNWIKQGGSTSLAFPAGLDSTQYDSKMLSQTMSAQVSCVSTIQSVGTAEKTCRNFLDSSNRPVIICNADRFLATSEAEQYVLVHHEYAGLSGFESNTNEESNYSISEQLTGNLEEDTIKRLVIMNTRDPFYRLRRSHGEYLGSYEIAGCTISQNYPYKDRNICNASKQMDLVLNDSDSNASGYRTVDMNFHDVNDATKVLSIVAASDMRGAELGKGSFRAKPTDQNPVDYQTTIKNVSGTTFLEWYRVDTAKGTFQKVSLVLKKK